MQPFKRLLALLLAGSAFGALFHVQAFWAVGIKLLCIAAVFVSVQDSQSKTPKSRALVSPFLLGWAWGAGATLTGMGWLYTAMHDVGGMPAALAGVAMGLFALLLGAFNGVAAAGAAWSTQRTQQAALPFVACWVLGEWLRTWVLTGLPWMSVGYGFLDTPLAGAAPSLGVLGVGAAAVGLAVCTALLITGRRVAAATAVAAAIYGCVLLLVCFAAQQFAFTQASGAPLSVALLQGNVPQTLKFDRAASQTYMQRYADMALQSTAQLTVMPETALPNVLQQLPAELQAKLSSAPQTLVVGTIGQTQGSQGVQYTNRLATPYAAQPWTYDKVHLVPFGEAIPSGLQWVVDLMRMPLSSLRRGAQGQADLTVGGLSIAANICYEEIFAHEWRARGGAAHLLLNASNFGWYGDSNVFAQHANIARMRALEFQKPYLSATNNGATLAVLPTGAVQASLAHNTVGTLAVSVQGMVGFTPYARWGDWGAVIAAFLLLAVLHLRAARHSRRLSPT